MKTINRLALASLIITIGMAAGINTAKAQKTDTLHHASRHGWRQSRDGHRSGEMRGGKMGIAGIPDLTDDQKKKIEALKTPFQKEILPIHNIMAEKRAHLQTLQTADKTDINAINTTIDELGNLQTQLMKKSAAYHEAIRKLLTDDQRVAFDSRSAKMHPRGGHFREYRQ